jgi:hypothetical protein
MSLNIIEKAKMFRSIRLALENHFLKVDVPWACVGRLIYVCPVDVYFTSICVVFLLCNLRIEVPARLFNTRLMAVASSINGASFNSLAFALSVEYQHSFSTCQ